MAFKGLKDLVGFQTPDFYCIVTAAWGEFCAVGGKLHWSDRLGVILEGLEGFAGFKAPDLYGFIAASGGEFGAVGRKMHG